MQARRFSSFAASVVALATAAVLALALGYIFYKAVQVAPEARAGADGRLHFHLKNVTRFGGTVQDVREAVARAVWLDDPAVPPEPASWQEQVLQLLAPPARPPHVVGLPAGNPDAAAWALPGAFWAVYANVPVVFLGQQGLTAESEALVRRYRAPVYVLAPSSLVPEAVVGQIRAITHVERVSGRDLAQHAIAIAEYRDEATGFGWGRHHGERDGYFQFVVTTPQEASYGYAALPLALSNATTFLYAADDGSLPGALDRYVWAQRADWFVNPGEGPFRHFWIVGNRLSYGSQGRLDLAIEKSPYGNMGEVGLGPLEAIALAFIALGLAGGLFVFLHGRRLLSDVMPATRLAWAFTALLLPVAGVVLYLAAYRRPRAGQRSMPEWVRPPAVQAAAATALSFGYGAPLMIAIAYLLIYFGLPLFFDDLGGTGLFWLGAGMPLMMLAMYAGAILVAWLLVQMPMRRAMQDRPASAVILPALGVTALSMTAVSLAMMTSVWWMTMAKFPGMPKEDDLLFVGAQWIAAGAGFLLAWPLNWVMVRAGFKPGVM
jgi:hypothetical protein